MGHQISFYATPTDISDLEDRIRALEAVRFVHSRSSGPEPRTLPSLNDSENGQRWLFYFLVREEDLGKILLKHVPTQGYWTIDHMRSPVIEFSSCYFDGAILRRGREHYFDGFYGEGDEWIVKPEAFRTWATNVLKVTKKSLTKLDEDYIGTDALAWLHKSAGELAT